MSEYERANEIVNKYVAEKSSNGILQHAPGWFEAKKKTIGGSQIAALIGLNPYENPYNLLLHKLGIKKFETNMVVQWGSLFEYLLRKHVENTLMCTIVGENLFIPGENPGVSYSPDGLGVVMLDLLKKIVLNPEKLAAFAGIYAPVLFEFKCLFRRQPKGDPPVYYKPQVKYGLDIIDVLDFGVFIEAVFRRCAADDLNFTNSFDAQLTAHNYSKKVVAVGYIRFYTVAKQLGEENIKLLQKFTQHVGMLQNVPTCIDAGCAPEPLFECIMAMWHEGILRAEYGEICYDNAPKIEAIGAVAILPWKLFRVDYHIIPREPGFLQNCLPKINEFMEYVNMCHAETHPDKLANLLDSYAKKYIGGIDY